MELNAAWFDDQLEEMGQCVEWRKAYICPCRDEDSGAPRLGCPTCGARGYFWPDAPVRCRTGIASMRVAKEWAQFGQWESGDAGFTIPESSALYACGDRDRVVMVESSEPFSTVLTRWQDVLPFPILQIDRVFYLPTPDSPPTDCAIPAFDATGQLTWPDPAYGPPPDAKYSIAGRKHQEYYVFRELPQDRSHFGGARLPRRIQMRRWDLFGR